MYFEFSYGNTTQYDFLCIFKILGRMQHTKNYFIVFSFSFSSKRLKKN
jgi:hypothetical protein